jgi:2-polyprenyl-3-methyl-5-hydroxy-6-metoxy-1,4-benzoquinol methylase
MTKKEWFADWFDTSYYHTLYKNRNEEEATIFIQNLIEHLSLAAGASVLDLACGKGRHSVTLNNLGFTVLGVDLSQNSIQQAKKFENETLHFSVHDMREVIPDKQFSAVFNLFTSFGYFDSLAENNQVIQSVHAMLEPNGLLVIDFMNAHKVIEHLVTAEEKVIDGIRFQIERKFDGTHIYKHIHVEDGEYKQSYVERVQALKQADFIELLENNDFTILSTFGDFHLGRFVEATSDRLILLAKKK